MFLTQFTALLMVTTLPLFSVSLPVPIVYAQGIGGNGKTDIFMIRTHAATTEIEQAPVIANFNWFDDGDKIGLPDGLTEADLDYQTLIDFDGDGLQDDTVVRLRSTGEILCVILNADDFVLDGEFIPITSQKPIACLRKANTINCEFPLPE
ncbi:MAG: hypothetical protein ACP5D7_19890 [Limnospira sp.]